MMSEPKARALTHEQKERLRAALESAFRCTTDPPRIDPTEDPFRVTRAVPTALTLEVGPIVVDLSVGAIEDALAELQERGGRCDDAEILLNALRPGPVAVEEGEA
jgi:hypothetical protein